MRLSRRWSENGKLRLSGSGKLQLIGSGLRLWLSAARLSWQRRRLRACGRPAFVVRLVGVVGSAQSSACPGERRSELHEAWRGADELPRARLPKAALVASVTRWEGTASDACSDR